jgi:hypothetical protein
MERNLHSIRVVFLEPEWSFGILWILKIWPAREDSRSLLNFQREELAITVRPEEKLAGFSDIYLKALGLSWASARKEGPKW